MTLIFIDGTLIKATTFDTKTPDVISKKASFSYYLDGEDKGQLLLEKAIYGGREVHEYTITNEFQTWVFEGDVCNYRLTEESGIGCPVYTMEVELTLVGKFEYTRGSMTVERDFTRK